MRAVYVGLQATVPMITVVIRKCYGMAGMGTTDKNGLGLKVAWPSLNGAHCRSKVGWQRRSDVISRVHPTQWRDSMNSRTELRALASPFRTAEAFGVEDIIDPRETRAYLCRFISAAQSRLKTDVGPKFEGRCAAITSID